MGDLDAEIKAMSSLVEALEPLDEAARQRVLRWAAERFDVSLSVHRQKTTKQQRGETGEPEDEHDENAENENGPNSFETFAELLSAAAPSTEADKVLVGGYWFQVIKGQKELHSFRINKELRHTGHAIDKMAREFDRLIDKKPQLAIQLKKSGKTAQARRTYKLTDAGIARVKGMLTSKG